MSFAHQLDSAPIAVLVDLIDVRRSHRLGYAPPRGFPAYARILHPLFRDVEAYEPDVTWREIAEITGGRIEARTVWAELVQGAGDVLQDADIFWQPGPFAQGLPRHGCEVLAEILSPTVSGECTFGVWAGFADLDYQLRTGAPHVTFAQRETVVLSGTLADASTDVAGHEVFVGQFRSVNIWLPPHAEWLVTTELYATSTLIAGSTEVIDAVLADPRLETLPIDESDVEYVLE